MLTEVRTVFWRVTGLIRSVTEDGVKDEWAGKVLQKRTHMLCFDGKERVERCVGQGEKHEDQQIPKHICCPWADTSRSLGRAKLTMPWAYGRATWWGSLEVTMKGRGGNKCPDERPERDRCETGGQGQTSENLPSSLCGYTKHCFLSWCMKFIAIIRPEHTRRWSWMLPLPFTPHCSGLRQLAPNPFLSAL